LKLGPLPRRWLFLTGAPRSGTTWLAKLLSGDPAVDYLHEPFNPDGGLPGFDTPFPVARGAADLSATQLGSIRNLLAYRASQRLIIYQVDSRSRRLAKALVGSRGQYQVRVSRFNYRRKAAIIKDPTGVFLTELLLTTFGIPGLVLVRHPYPVIESFLRLGLSAEPIIAALPHLPRPARQLIAADADNSEGTRGNDIARLAFAWRIIYGYVTAVLEPLSPVHIARFEDYAADPMRAETLSAQLSLPWSGRSVSRVTRYSRPSHPTVRQTRYGQQLWRNSAGLAKRIDGALPSPADRLVVDSVVAGVGRHFYPEPVFWESTDA